MKKLALILSFSFAMFIFIAHGVQSTSKSRKNTLPPEISLVNELVSDSLISFKAEVANPYFLSNNTNQSIYLYLEAKANKFEPIDKKRAPLNISLVIDRSGSMNGDKIKYVKEAAKFVIDNLGDDDYLSIVIYDNDVEVLFKSSKISNKALLKRKVDLITDRGSTNLSGGMLEGYAQVESTFKNGYVNRVLLLSDGLANNGITDEKILQSIVKKNNHEKGITISTFGVGADFSENMMLGLAENGSGNYYFIKSPDEIPTIFKKELRGLLTVVAQNVKLEITIPENLKVNKVFGANYELSSNVLKVNFRDICSEETKAVLIRFDINNTKESQINFKSILTFDDVVKTFSKKSLIAKSIVNNTSDTFMYTKSNNKEVTEQIILFESNEMLELAMKAVDEGNYEQAKSIVKSNKTNISNATRAGYANKEIVMQDSVNTLYSDQLKNIETMKEYDKKMMQKDSKSSNYMLKKKRI